MEPCPAEEANPFGFVALPDPALVAEGWQLRTFTDPKKAEEATGLYRGYGYEVRREPVRPENLPEECDACATNAVCQSYVLIYTRKKV